MKIENFIIQPNYNMFNKISQRAKTLIQIEKSH